jgi:hypothetical protein
MNFQKKIEQILADKIASGNFYRGTLGELGTGVGILTASNLLGIKDAPATDSLPRVNYVKKFAASLAENFIGSFFQKYQYDFSLAGANQDIFVIKTDVISDLNSINNWVGKIAQHAKISQLISTLYTLGFKDFVVTTWNEESAYTYKLVEL